MNRFSGKPRKLAGASLDVRPKPKIWVWRLEGGERGTMVIYSPKVHGVTVHFDPSKTRSAPHFDDGEPCDGCNAELPKKELYYLFGFHHEKARLVFLEMPRGAADALRTMLAMGETLRGLGLHIERTKADNGRLRFRFIPVEMKTKLPPDRHPQETLFAMWGVPIDDQADTPIDVPPSNGFFHQNGTK